MSTVPLYGSRLEVTQRWHMNSPHKWKEVLEEVQMNYSSSNISQNLLWSAR